MTTAMAWITGISLLVLLLLACYRYTQTKNMRAFLLQTAVLVLYVAFLHALFDFPFDVLVASRAGEASENIYTMIALYACMLLGMFAQYGYTRFSQPQRKRKKIDRGLFLAPFFLSPIIFSPLLGALQNAEIDLNRLDALRLMTFIVAFEHGFFWKVYFDHLRGSKDKNDE